MSRATWKYRALAMLNAMLNPSTESTSVKRARESMRKPGPAFIMGRRAPVAAVHDERVSGVRVRRYVPQTVKPGVLVYFHGGGWVIGDVESHDVVTSALAALTQREVVSVDYRLAPEHRYPAAFEDCLSVTRALLGQRVVVAGDSAGGGLSASVANVLGAQLAAQVLVYPVTDCAAETASYETYATGHLLTRETMRYYRREYVPDDERRKEPGCSPLRATSVKGAAPAYVLLAGCDVLRDEGRAYAQRLQADGVETVVDEVPGVLHGFLSLQGLAEGRAAAERVAGWLETKW